MTREEAENILAVYRVTCVPTVKEALDMAIEALMAQRDEIDCKYCVYINPRTCDCDNFICKKYKMGAK